MDHECLDALKAATKEKISQHQRQEPLISEMERKLEVQYEEFISLVRSITKRNKFV